MDWIKAAGIRALKTAGQTGAAVLSLWASGADVDMRHLLYVVAIATAASLFTSLAGLPELDRGEGDGNSAD